MAGRVLMFGMRRFCGACFLGSGACFLGCGACFLGCGACFLGCGARGCRCLVCDVFLSLEIPSIRHACASLVCCHSISRYCCSDLRRSPLSAYIPTSKRPSGINRPDAFSPRVKGFFFILFCLCHMLCAPFFFFFVGVLFGRLRSVLKGSAPLPTHVSMKGMISRVFLAPFDEQRVRKKMKQINVPFSAHTPSIHTRTLLARSGLERVQTVAAFCVPRH